MMAEAKPSRIRISRVRFRGLRTASDVVLDLEPMNVLIGPNGVGKSTLVEGLDILSKIPSGEGFLRALNDEHGGTSRLLRRGESQLQLDVEFRDGDLTLTYQLSLARRNGSFAIDNESLYCHGDDEALFVRDGDNVLSGSSASIRPSPRSPLLVTMSAIDLRVEHVPTALGGIEVHIPFATQPRWFGLGMVPERNMRTDNLVQATDRLDRGGANLANAFHALRNRPDWPDTLETIRLLIDDDIINVTTPASASGGSIGLAVSYRSSGSIPAFALSDGTLSLLALTALARLDDGQTPRSLLVLDEPDLHLHPGAVGQLVALLEECSARQPVVIATHSDRVLDGLSEPARSTILCELDEQRRLQLRRPDRTQLDRWLQEYRGLGQLRAEGYDRLVFPRPRAAEKA